MKRIILLAAIAALATACAPPQTSNDVARERQNDLLDEATKQVPMPAITKFRELKTLNQVLELRDREDYATYTYNYSEMQGKYSFFCDSIAYPIPYATQRTAPETMQTYNIPSKNGSEHHYGATRLPQADPNGLFSPASADATWIVCKDPTPGSKKVGIAYVEPKMTTVPWKLPESMLIK